MILITHNFVYKLSKQVNISKYICTSTNCKHCKGVLSSRSKDNLRKVHTNEFLNSLFILTKVAVAILKNEGVCAYLCRNEIIWALKDAL